MFWVGHGFAAPGSIVHTPLGLQMAESRQCLTPSWPGWPIYTKPHATIDLPFVVIIIVIITIINIIIMIPTNISKKSKQDMLDANSRKYKYPKGPSSVCISDTTRLGFRVEVFTRKPPDGRGVELRLGLRVQGLGLWVQVPQTGVKNRMN